MKNAIVALMFLLASSCAWANMLPEFGVTTVVELPSQYTAEEVDVILQSINYERLAQDADKSFPAILKANIKFFFTTDTLRGSEGAPGHVIVIIGVLNEPPDWGKDAELKNFLGLYLEKIFTEKGDATKITQ